MLVSSAFIFTPVSVLASTKRYVFLKSLYPVILVLVQFSVHLKAQGRNTAGLWPCYRKTSPKGVFS